MRAVLLGLVAFLLTVPTTAWADMRTVELPDPVGDAAPAELDIRDGTAGYDTEGAVAFMVTLGAEPGDALLTGYAATGPSCGPPVVEVFARLLMREQHMLLNGSERLADPYLEWISGNPTESTYSLVGSDPRLANLPFDCFRVETRPVGAAPGSPAADTVSGHVGSAPPAEPPNPGAPNSCRVASPRVRLGRVLVVRCRGVSGVVTARFKRGRGRASRVRARVRAGRALFATRRLRRGRYRVSIGQAGRVLGAGIVRVR